MRRAADTAPDEIDCVYGHPLHRPTSEGTGHLGMGGAHSAVASRIVRASLALAEMKGADQRVHA